MRVLAFAASNSRKSINRELINYSARLLKRDLNNRVEIEIIDINDFEMPIYSVDRENDSGIPDAAHQFYNKITQADALIISFAEHNGTYTAAFKNLYDWSSRIDMKVYQGKPMLLLSTSPGPGGANNVLESAKTSAPHFGGDVKGVLSIPKFYENFNIEKGQMNNAELQTNLESMLSILVEDHTLVDIH